jgi:hypothetical protein
VVADNHDAERPEFDTCIGVLADDGAPLCSKAGSEDRQQYGEDDDEIEDLTAEMIEYFEIDENHLIKDAKCHYWEAKIEELSEFYQESLEFYCENYNFEKRADLDRKFLLTMVMIAFAILIFCMILCCWMIGFGKIAKQVFYFITFRWLLKLIIKIRSKGKKVAKVYQQPEPPQMDLTEHDEDDPWNAECTKAETR